MRTKIISSFPGTWIKILLLGVLITLTSCDALVCDIPVSCVNQTNKPIYMVFFVTDYPMTTISNIVTNNRLPVILTADVPANTTVNLTIYEPDRLGIWYGAYINDTLYVTGKVQNPIIKIE